MNDHIHLDGNIRAGTIGGTFLVVLFNLFMHDVFRSALLAFVGATVSFFVSFALKYVMNRFRKNRIEKRKNNKQNIH
jgi:hypothetical protein